MYKMNFLSDECAELAAMQKELELQKAAKALVLQRKWTQYFNLQFELGLLGNDSFGTAYTKLRNDIKDLKNKLKSEYQLSERFEYLWITVSMSPNVDLGLAGSETATNRFKRKIERFCNRKMFSSYIFVLEQRNELIPFAGLTAAEVGKPLPTAKLVPSGPKWFCGQHSHLLLKRNPAYCYSQIVRNTKNTFRSWCDVENSKILHIRKCPSEFVPDKLEYILGTKTAEGKSGKQLMDVKWRSENGLEKFYESDDKFFSHFKS